MWPTQETCCIWSQPRMLTARQIRCDSTAIVVQKSLVRQTDFDIRQLSCDVAYNLLVSGMQNLHQVFEWGYLVTQLITQLLPKASETWTFSSGNQTQVVRNEVGQRTQSVLAWSGEVKEGRCTCVMHFVNYSMVVCYHLYLTHHRSILFSGSYILTCCHKLVVWLEKPIFSKQMRHFTYFSSIFFF